MTEMGRTKRKHHGPSFKMLILIAGVAACVAVVTNWSIFISLTERIFARGQISTVFSLRQKAVVRTNPSSCGVCVYESEKKECRTTSQIRTLLRNATKLEARGDFTRAQQKISEADSACQTQGECYLRIPQDSSITAYTCESWGKLACDYTARTYQPSSQWLIPEHTFMPPGSPEISKWFTINIADPIPPSISIDGGYCHNVYVQSSFHSNTVKGVQIASQVIPAILKGEQCVQSLQYEDRGCQSLCGLAYGGVQDNSAGAWMGALSGFVTMVNKAVIANRSYDFIQTGSDLSCKKITEPRNENSVFYTGYPDNTLRAFGLMLAPPGGGNAVTIEMGGHTLSFGGAGGNTCEQMRGISCNGIPPQGKCPIVTRGANILTPAKLEFATLSCKNIITNELCDPLSTASCVWQ